MNGGRKCRSQAMLKLLKLSKLAKRLRMSAISRKVSGDSWTSISGVESLGRANLSSYLRSKFAAFIPGCPDPGSLNGIIESKKSAERRNVINDKNREWTDSPNQQKSQTQPDYDLVHITSMRKTRTRLIFSHRQSLASFLSHGVSWQRIRAAEKSVDPGTCDTSPGFPWYSHRRFRREWFF